jgi:hypothetical protein
MNLNKLASAIAKQEGKKHQASIGDIREILKIIVDFEAGSLVNVASASPSRFIRARAIELANKYGYVGGEKDAKQGTAKVSKKNKIKRIRDRAAKRSSKIT